LTQQVSIIIPNLNGAKYLPACFSSLTRQTCADFETILVDDGSTDDSVALTRRDYPWVRIIQLERQGGFIAGINRGFQAAQGEILIALNNDTEVDERWVAALVAALAANPQAGMAASKIRLHDRRLILHSAGDAFGQDGIPINRGVWQEDIGQFDQDRAIFGGCGGAVAYRRAMLTEIGLFDQDLFMYCEDVDLNWRAQLAGYQCVFVPEALVYHHLSATGGGELASYHTGRNTILVLVKSVPDIVWRNHFPKIIAAQLQVAFEALRAWRGRAARARLRGQLAGLWQIPRWLGKRRQIQATRRVSETYLESLLQK
jgi:GT2 family glycosyltransferase